MARKRRLNDLGEQPEFDGMPEESDLGKAARKVLRIEDKIDNVNEKLELELKEARSEVVEMMRKEGKREINVDGYKFWITEKPAATELKHKHSARRKKKEEKESEED